VGIVFNEQRRAGCWTTTLLLLEEMCCTVRNDSTQSGAVRAIFRVHDWKQLVKLRKRKWLTSVVLRVIDEEDKLWLSSKQLESRVLPAYSLSGLPC
jgi:hypothetical protein